MLYFIIYMMQVIPIISDMARTLAGISLALTLMLGLGCLMNIGDPCTTKITKFVKILGITCCALFLLALLIPDKTTLYQMSVVYFGKQINKSVQVDDKIQKISTIVDLQLDSTIKDLINNAKEQ